MSAMLMLGYVVTIVGGLWLLVVAFQTSVGWGIGSLLVPFVSLVFVVMHWDESKRPFLIQVVGLVLIYFGVDTAVDVATLE